MGDLLSEINELKSLNIFLHAIKGLPDVDLHPCLNSINYHEIVFPKFKIPIEDEKEKRLSPDFLLWNIDKKTAIIIEVKGGNSIEDSDIKQILNYAIIPIDQVQELIRNILEEPLIEIDFIYTGIVYYNRTIENCYKSPTCSQKLESLRNEFIVLKQNPGNKLEILNVDIIDFDKDLKELLRNGIQIPLNPRQFVYITENPSIEGTMWAIVNYIHNKFYEGLDLNEISTDPISIRDEFSYSSVKLKKIRKALNYLTDLKCCLKEENTYTFQFQDLGNLEDLKNKIQKIDTTKPPLIQQKLEKWGK